ncbi:MAG: DUF1573 domain-containing protein [Planctomycetaceae bacterium]|nr:DUF1573 domain-containing protein [Planctomycetaceae bacterium]
MKPVSVLLALLTFGVALSAVAWMTKQEPPDKNAKELQREEIIKQSHDELRESFSESEKDPEIENPFDLTGTGPKPKAVIDYSMHEFGSMELGQTEHYTFTIRNEGEAPLKLHLGVVQCKCTVADLDQDEIPPGESAEIEMSWKPIATEAEFHQKAELWTNDPENPKVELHVKGAVVKLVTIYPPGVWNFNNIQEGEVREISGVIASQHLDQFNILDYESSTELMTATFEPMSDDQLAEHNVKCGYQIHVTLKGDMPVGRFRGKLTLKTDIKDGEQFEIDLDGIRPGPFSILGENWFAGKMLARFGDVQKSQGKTIKLSMFVTRGEEPIEFEVLSTDPPFVNLTFEKDESFDVPTREKYSMVLTIPPDAPIGAWSEDRVGTILVKTNNEAVPEFQLNVEMIIRE